MRKIVMLLFALLLIAPSIAAQPTSNPTTGVITGSLNRALANALYCKLAGCTMAGNLAMGANAITFPSNQQIITDGAGGFLLRAYTPAPTVAPTVALAGLGAGNVTNGTHVVAYEWVTAGGATGIGTASTSVNVTDNSTNGQIAVTVIALGNQFVTIRNVAMSKANTATPLYLVAANTVNNNTATIYTINVSDATLNTNGLANTTNTALDTRATVNNNGQLLVGNGTAAAPSYSFLTAPSTGTYFNSSVLWSAIVGIPRFAVDAGAVYVTGTLNISPTTINTNSVYLVAPAAANLQLGVNSATPIAQTFNLAPSVTAGGATTDTKGARVTLKSGNGVGTKGSGDFVLQTAPGGATGNTAGTFTDRIVLASTQVTLAESSATPVADVAIAASTVTGGTLTYTIRANDATDAQVLRGRVMFAAENKAGTVVCTISTPEEIVAVPAGGSTLTNTVTCTSSATSITLNLNAVSSLTQTTLYAYVRVDHDGLGLVTTK
jgi:hypothetical protein